MRKFGSLLHSVIKPKVLTPLVTMTKKHHCTWVDKKP